MTLQARTQVDVVFVDYWQNIKGGKGCRTLRSGCHLWPNMIWRSSALSSFGGRKAVMTVKTRTPTRTTSEDLISWRSFPCVSRNGNDPDDEGAPEDIPIEEGYHHDIEEILKGYANRPRTTI